MTNPSSTGCVSGDSCWSLMHPLVLFIFAAHGCTAYLAKYKQKDVCKDIPSTSTVLFPLQFFWEVAQLLVTLPHSKTFETNLGRVSASGLQIITDHLGLLWLAPNIKNMNVFNASLNTSSSETGVSNAPNTPT